MAILNTVAQIGRYVLRSRVSATRACEVWLAELEGTTNASPVVFKKLRATLAQDPAIARAFEERARHGMRTSHECIARIFDVISERGDAGFAMEYVDGKTLRQLISAVGGAGNALPVWFAIHVARCVCQALEHAHQLRDEQGKPLQLLHENLCPEDVFLTFLGHVKVTDFGLSQAALTRAGSPNRAATSQRPTFLYGQESHTPGTIRHDLDGVGCVLYELLTGIGPASPSAPHETFIAPSHYAPWISHEVDQLVSRVLSPNDVGQFQTAAEIRVALDEYLSTRRHDVTATHIAGLVSVLFSAECRDSAPPTMRLQESAVQMAIRRSRRTSPPDTQAGPGHEPVAPAESVAQGPASSQLTRPPPAPAVVSVEQGAATHSPSPVAQRRQSDPSSETRIANAESADQKGPFRHDWDLALKRAREEAQTSPRSSGTIPVANPSKTAESLLDPVERAVREFERGLEFMRTGDLERAMKAWELALEFDPQHRVCRANLNLLKKKLGSST